MNQNLVSMLAELKSLDPETWESIGKIANVIVINEDGSFSADAYAPDWIIAGELMRAIAAKPGWRLQLDIHEGRVLVFIWLADMTLIDRSGSKIASTVLASYLAALRGSG